MSTEQVPVDTLGFEEALKELEDVVRRLETGRIKLEEAVATYERGVALKNHCSQKLNDAKLKVDKLMIDKNGTITGKEFFDERPQR